MLRLHRVTARARAESFAVSILGGDKAEISMPPSRRSIRQHGPRWECKSCKTALEEDKTIFGRRDPAEIPSWTRNLDAYRTTSKELCASLEFTEIVMNDAEFYNRLIRDVESTTEKLRQPNNSRGFVAWLGTYYFEIDDPDDVKNGICDGGNDQGIDGIFFNEEERLVEIVQVKLPAPQNVKNAFPESEAVKTFAGVELITVGPFMGKVSPRLEELAKRYLDLVNNSGYGVRITFFSLFSPLTSDTHVEFFHQKFEQIGVDFVGFDDLKGFFENEYLVRRPQPPARLAFPVVGEILLKKAPKFSAVFSILGVDLAKSVLEYGARLFQDNVRLFLGSRKRSTNFRIQETAESDTESLLFWYYNNGINVVCKRLEIPPTRKVVTLHRPQIVNGAQTSYSLSRALENGTLRPDTLVLVKAVQEEDRDFISKLTLYTNSQNPVRLRDFAANDAEQVQIGKICRAMRYFYEKKRGEFEDEFPTPGEREGTFGADWGNRVINNERASQYYVAWQLRLPAQAKTEKRNIFNKDTGGLYSRIFTSQVVPEAFVFLHVLGRYVEEREWEYRQAYADVDEEPAERKDKVLADEFVLHADLFIIALLRPYLARFLGVEEFAVDAYVRLTKEMEANPAVLKEPYDMIVSDLRPFVAQKRTDPKYYHNKFFKSEQAFGEILYYLRHEAGREFIES